MLVGAGPGDPDLLTIKAVKALRKATVVLVDDLVDRRVLRWTRRSARIVDVGKRGGCSSTPQAFIEKLMVREALRGERVVRLKGGDPLVFGRAGEEIAALACRRRRSRSDQRHHLGPRGGIRPWHLADPSRLREGGDVHHRPWAAGRRQRQADASEAGVDGGGWPGPPAALKPVDCSRIANAAGGVTLVVYMGLARLEQVRDGLLAALPPSTPAALVERASQAAGRQVSGSLQDLLALAAEHRVASPAILIVGRVLEEVVSRAVEEARKDAPWAITGCASPPHGDVQRLAGRRKAGSD